MNEVTAVGLDLAKNVFQVHGVDAAGQVVLRRKLRRNDVEDFFRRLPPLTIGMAACGGAHYWGRLLEALGHRVRLMPPTYVKPYVKRGKTDAADAEAICEAVTRPTMRFVPTKTTAQQAAAAELKVRQLLIDQRTRTVNALRGHLAEFGVVTAKGIWRVGDLIAIVQDVGDSRLPDVARAALLTLTEQIKNLDDQIDLIETAMVRRSRADETARRLASVPGIGAITATALQALVPDPSGFKSGRHFAAWLGLTPRVHSSGGKERLGRISRAGNTTLRALFVLGATARLRYARQKPEATDWVTRLLARRPFKVAAIALANKMARIAWALLVKGGVYKAPAAA